jgi:hypothetical protein
MIPNLVVANSQRWLCKRFSIAIYLLNIRIRVDWVSIDKDTMVSSSVAYFQETNNITSDGFYDMGPVREGDRFLTLDELATQPLNDRRPIIIVHAPDAK